MINQSDIDAMQPNKAVFERVVDRAQSGKSSDRLINANEYLPLIRYARFCEKNMFALAYEVKDAQERAIASMGCYTKDGERGDK